MKRIFLPLMALLLSASSALAATTTQKWTPGWQNLSEPLNYKKSNVKWSVNPTKRTLSVTFTLVGAVPSKLYQVGVGIFCTTFPTTFGQFPVDDTSGGNCDSWDWQGVPETQAYVAFGVVTTDINGDGSFEVVVGPIASGTYDIEFVALDGAGCFLTGSGSDCTPDFQSPGPTYGDTTTITIP